MLLLFSVLFCTLFAYDCGFIQHNITSSGMNRRYFVHIPQAFCLTTPATKFPKTFMIHGYGASAQEFYKELNAKTAVVPLIYLDGYKNSWNAKYCCGAAKHENIDDLQYFRDVLADIEFNFFSSQIYVSGHSNGAFFTSYITMFIGVEKALPMEGFYYDIPKNVSATDIMMVWGGKDTTVRPTGCCWKSICCCFIFSMECVDYISIFNTWMGINQCSGFNMTKDEEKECHIGYGCEKSTKTCLFYNYTHHPMPLPRILDFFDLPDQP